MVWLLALLFLSTHAAFPDGIAVCAISQKLGHLNWNCRTDYCGFEGLKCDADNYVKTIEIQYLITPIPTEIALFPRLQHLAISTSLTFDPLPTELGQLSSLRHLLLLDLPLMPGSLPESLSKLTNLEQLVIVNCPRLGGVLPLSPRMTQMRNITIDGTLISGSIPIFISNYLSLKSLTISDSQMQGVVPRLGSLTNLTILDLSSNFLKGTIPVFKPPLSVINLNKNQFSGTIPALCDGSQSFSTINLADNNLSGGIRFPLSSCANVIDFSGNSLSGTLPTAPSNTPKSPFFRLRVLKLSFNRLSGTIPFGYFLTSSLNLGHNNFSGTLLPQNIIQQTSYPLSINHLNLQSNSLTGEVSKFLTFAPNLISLNLASNQFQGVINMALQKKLSDVLLFDNFFTNFTRGTNDRADLFSFFPQRPYCDAKTYPCKNQYTSCVDSECQCLEGFEGPQDKCKDIDECYLGLWQSRKSFNTNQSCRYQEQCFNIIGSFRCCYDGYFANGSRCDDIDECLTGLWKSRDSNNTRKPCDSADKCINRPGYFLCCPDGFTASNGSCVDINECLVGNPCSPGTYCLNTNGSFICPQCEEARSLLETKTKFNHYDSLEKYPNIVFQHKTCLGQCESGIKYFTFLPVASLCSVQVVDLDAVLCSFACRNLTSRNTADTSIETLKTEFQRGRFLEDVVGKIWNVSVSFTRKRANTLDVVVNPCTKDFSRIVALIQELSLEIVPNAPGFQAIAASNCLVSLTSTDPADDSLNGLIIGLVIGFSLLLLVLVLLFFFYSYWSDEMKLLPKEVAWSYQQYKLKPFAWSFSGSKKSGYYFQDLDPESEFYQKALKLFESFQLPKIDLVQGITAVYNPVLVRNFVGNFQIALSRSKAAEFKQSTVLDDPTKAFVFQKYEALCSSFEWNKSKPVPIIPMIHGTDLLIAEKICENGFAALSSLDAGYFGKGIYFTSFVDYTIRYVAPRTKPAIIVSWIIPGSVYPVTEDHQGQNSLLGAAIKPGYSSHYVLTNKEGSAVIREQRELFNELVVSQESQITPAYIIQLQKPPLKALLKEWNRAPSLSVSGYDDSMC